MSNIVYATTFTKPAPEMALSNALASMIIFVFREDVKDQSFEQTGPWSDDEGRALCFRLTTAGIGIFRNGVVGPPTGWREWPSEVPEPDFTQYLITS